MSDLLPLIVPILLVAAITIAGVFLIRAWNNRTNSVQAAYNVGQHEARREMQINILRAFAVIAVGVILLAVFLTARLFQPEQLAVPTLVPTTVPVESETAVPATPTTPPTVIEASNTATPLPTQPVPVVPTEMPTEPAPTQPPLATDTPAPETAVVSSGVGVWLRSEPSTEGEQLEWLLQGTQLILLDGSSQGETFIWQQVQAPSGIIGWVADEFIEQSGS